MGHQNLGLGLVAAVACSVLSASPASAANWWFLAGGKARVVYADLDSIAARKFGGVPYTEVKTLTRTARPDADGVRYTQMTISFDCKSTKTFAPLTTYQDDKGVMVLEDVAVFDPSTMIKVKPGDTYEIMRLFACNASQMSGLETFAINGRTFTRVPDARADARRRLP
ncbi:hypothetical protein [Phenylobacterium conjunctum]|uniref:Uncharacterized protein n=1 Tax=Phenylobacterium conjunctum TaxID=1298959 RepID=A0ABW3SYA2_9CAUL